MDVEPGRVLVVDDNRLNRVKMTRVLEQQGHTVIAVDNGAQAIQAAGSYDFDVVLLDILMPGMDGYQVLERWREGGELQRDFRVIVISAVDDMESVVRCIKMGADDYLPKPFDPVLLRARVESCLGKQRLLDELVKTNAELARVNSDLKIRNEFIRTTFGRYMTEEIVASVLDSPEGLELGGENRTVTVLMSDLRNFTTISEAMRPEQVVTLLNRYLEAMVEVIVRYDGTIDDFIGDGILVIFGAPHLRDDDAQRAVACALDMQLAMAGVNEWNLRRGFPELGMGISINTGEVVVGNIGSRKRMKYGVVGSPVNITSRIQDLTIGGQILISESTSREVGEILKIGGWLRVKVKGVSEPITILDVEGIGGDHDLSTRASYPGWFDAR